MVVEIDNNNNMKNDNEIVSSIPYIVSNLEPRHAEVSDREAVGVFRRHIFSRWFYHFLDTRSYRPHQLSVLHKSPHIDSGSLHLYYKTYKKRWLPGYTLVVSSEVFPLQIEMNTS